MTDTTSGRSRVRAQRNWTESDARQALLELTSTGETVAAFAKRRGVSVQRVYWWKQRVAPSGELATKFVAVALPQTARPSAASACSIEVVIGNVVLRVRETHDAEYVARLVAALSRRGGSAC